MTAPERESAGVVEFPGWFLDIVSASTPDLPPIPHKDCITCQRFMDRGIVPTYHEWLTAHRLYRDVQVAKFYEELQ